jgi:hypothetical protein
MMRNIIVAVTTITCALAVAGERKHEKVFVADEATAIKIAYAAFKAKYDDVTGPYHATLKDGVWTVDSTFQTIPGIMMFGGPAHAQIRQSDGKILKIEHEE